jgi:Ca2+-binding RTX toxin-like protein
VTGFRRVVPATLALGALILLAWAAGAAAHQKVTIEEGGGFLGDAGSHLVIRGDDRNDLVTVIYDPLLNEFLIGHDIEDPIPEGCYRDSKEPFHILHCPAGLINGRIYVYTGVGNDKVVISAKAKDVIVLTRAFLGTGFDSFEGDEEDDEVDGEEGGDQARLGGGEDTFKGGKGGDKAFGGAGVDRLFGGASSDVLYGGPGDDLLAGGSSRDHCYGGPGKERVVSCEIGLRY